MLAHTSRSLPQDGSGRLRALDGLRGIAVALVMVNHFTWMGGMAPSATIDDVYFVLTTAGWIGVDLFFVLSGFLITGILLDTKGHPHYFSHFYLRRILRIFPLYYGALAAFFIVAPWLVGVSAGYHERWGGQSWYWTYLINVSIAVNGWPTNTSLAHFWSLAVEEQFYLFWPLVVVALSRRGLVVACLGCVLASVAFRVWVVSTEYWLAAYVLTPARMDALAVGALLAILVRSYPDWLFTHATAVQSSALFAGVLLVAAALVRGGMDSEDPVILGFGLTAIALFFGATLAVALIAPPNGAVARWLNSPMLALLGRYSYALYAFHVPVSWVLAAKVFTVAGVPTIGGSQLPGQLLFAAAAGTISLALAAASWHFFESPVLQLKRHFPYGGGGRVRPLADRVEMPPAAHTLHT